jgi:hypothetical protein
MGSTLLGAFMLVPAAILLSTALIVALVNRYVWDFISKRERRNNDSTFSS